jgi:hypothetical protein
MSTIKMFELSYVKHNAKFIESQNNFSSSLCAYTSSEAHPASYPIGTEDPFPRAKRGKGVTLTTLPPI